MPTIRKETKALLVEKGAHMLILIDDANPVAVAEVLDTLALDGITTNPTILAGQGRDPLVLLKELKALLPDGGQLHVQVVGTDPATMVAEAIALRGALGEQIFVKIPVTAAGFIAMKELAAMGVNVTATAVYSPLQAFLAAKAGVKYVAPYINRLDNLGVSGIKVASDIQDSFNANGMETQILAASFKNSQQILELAKIGVGAATAAPAVLKALFASDTTAAAVAQQRADFEEVIGRGKNWTDVIG